MAKRQMAYVIPSYGRLIICAFWVAFAAGSFNARAGPFRASVVKIDITPDKPQWLLGYDARQSTGAHDHIFHRIVAMDDGKIQFFLISTDICLYSPSVYDEVSRELSAQTGVKPLQVWWSVTHTHSAPEVGPPGLGEALLQGAVRARSQHGIYGPGEKAIARGDRGSAGEAGAGAVGSGLGIRECHH